MSTTAGTWLVPESARALTPHRNPARPGRPWSLDLVVVHYTATPWSARHPEQAGSDRGRQLAWLRGERGKTSTHLDVLRDGEVLQGAPLEDRTWHSGGSAWTSPEGAPRDDVNRRSIGIDLDNVGRLYSTAGGVVDSYEWARMHTAGNETRPSYTRPPARPARTIHGGPTFADTSTGRLWEAYTAAQMRAFLRLVVRLRDLHPQLADPRRWVGHEHIRGTKSDPGPAFPWPWLQAALQPGFTAETVDLIDWRAVRGVVE